MNETAETVLSCIREYPGIHLRGIERTLGISSALVHYHVKDLLKKRAITAEESHGYTRYFATGDDAPDLSREDRNLLALLREERPAGLVLLLLDEGALAHGDLAARTGLAKSTVTYHVGKLTEAGVVEAAPDGRLRVKAERRVRRLLLAHRPTPDLRSKFERLWSDFYG